MSDSTQFKWPAGKASAIMVAENIIDKSMCSDLISQLKKSYSQLFSPGPTLGGLNPSIKNSMDTGLSYDVLVANNIPIYPLHSYEQAIAQNVFQCIEYYREQFRQIWDWNTIADTGFRVQEYKRGLGFYREHIDGGMGNDSASDRVLGAIVYLNDVEIGGETYFREHDLMVPAKAGSVSLFPAHWTHPHQGCVPISDDKWIISTFVVNTLLTDAARAKSEKEIVISSTPMPQESEK